jgi:hypothetical protein
MLVKAMVTLISNFADVSTNTHPKRMARSRPSIIPNGLCISIQSPQKRKFHTFEADFIFNLHIALVTDEDNGEMVFTVSLKQLLMEFEDFLERCARRDRVDKKKTFSYMYASRIALHREKSVLTTGRGNGRISIPCKRNISVVRRSTFDSAIVNLWEVTAFKLLIKALFPTT